MSNLEQIRETIENARNYLEQGQVRSEAGVRQSILNPLLRRLGWNTGDPSVVGREYVVSSGKSHYQLDYALFDRAGRVVFVVEAKAPGKVDDAATNQLFGYATSTETHLGLTTDGRSWFFYLPLGAGTAQERLVRSIDLTTVGPGEASRVLERYLARGRVLSGLALRAATEDRDRFALQRVVQSGWASLVAGPNDKLVKTIATSARAVATRKGLRTPAVRALNAEIRAFIRDGFAFSADVPVVAADPPSRRSLSQAVRPPNEAARFQRSRGGAAWIYRGERRVEKNPTELFVAVIAHLYETQGGVGFYKKLQEAIRGRKRLQIARTPEDTGVIGGGARQLPGGWYISTSLSTKTKLRYLERACKVAGVVFGSDLMVEID